ncbi:Ferritin-like [Streptomyces sp. yr375]|uniref:ferritin-like domain-containing protein n=1 Tax=Streptomyces sp. yr375 TaxID=1761906 RepID=UPI0008CFC422|nr:ferritin-like protein [Streptomyces sp. yr375]SES47543.1 Ferritin-like [Streptomyces sp. yr375]
MTDSKRIKSLGELKAALQLAVGLELSTIPVYLTGLYSIKDGTNTEAVQTIRSVVMEEMLHMTLAANVLNALRTVPSPAPVTFRGQEISPIPVYPLDSPLIAGIGTLELGPLTPQAVAGYVDIEHPLHGATKLSEIPLGSCVYATIGEFYEAILAALADPAICPDSEFDHRNQVPAGEYYGGAGFVIEVKDRETARQAIQKIIDEGEGLDPAKLGDKAKTVTDDDKLRNGWQMYSHYVRFREIQSGRRFRSTQLANQEPEGALLLVDYDSVHPALHIAINGDTVGGPEGAALSEFDLAYTRLVDDLYLAFSGKPKQVPDKLADSGVGPRPALPIAVHGMYGLKNMAVALMRTPSPVHRGQTLCPRFFYARTQDARDKLREGIDQMREQSR